MVNTLPQRKIRHFKGETLEWTSFWETFYDAIHTSSLTVVPKFNYLKEYLQKKIRFFFESLELTDANYQITINELKKAYGKKKC